MFLLKATVRRDTVAGFIAHLPASWGYISPDKRSNAHRDFFIFFYFYFIFFISSALSSSLNYFSQTGIYLFYLFGGCYWLFAFRSRHFKREGLKVFVILHVNRSDATLLLSKQAVKSFNVSSRWLPDKVWWVLLLLQSPKILSGVHSNNKSAVLQSGFFFCSFAIW